MRWFCSIAKSCLTLHNPTDCGIPGFPVLHYLPEFDQVHVHWVSDSIQPSHPLPSPVLLPSVFPSIRVFSCQVAKLNEDVYLKQNCVWIHWGLCQCQLSLWQWCLCPRASSPSHLRPLHLLFLLPGMPSTVITGHTSFRCQLPECPCFMSPSSLQFCVPLSIKVLCL